MADFADMRLLGLTLSLLWYLPWKLSSWRHIPHEYSIQNTNIIAGKT